MRNYRIKQFCGALCLAIMLVACTTKNEIIVSPDGKASNEGTASSPMSFTAAIAQASKMLKAGDIKKGDDIAITLQDGIYNFTEAIVLGEEFTGTAKNPIVIKAAEGAKVIFDGRADIKNPETFAKVVLPEELKRLPESVKDKVLVKTLINPALIEMLGSKIVLSLGIDEDQYLPAVYPNEGFAMLNTKPAVVECFPPGIPKNKQGYGIRAGQPPFRDMNKPAGWLGSLEDPRGAESGISERADKMAGSWKQWEAELKYDNTRNTFTGFYEAIWKLSSMPIYAVNAAKQTIHLPKAFSYGFGWLKTQPFRVFGLLCELDTPGEWYFDTKTNRLYVYPAKDFSAETKIGLPVASGFLSLNNCAYVQVVGINVRNVGSGIIFNIEGGSHNLIAACSAKNSTAKGMKITGTYNGVRSSDFVDLNSHVTLSGGKRSPSEITSANNYVENCHFYHKNFKHEKVNILVEGVGNIFRNNLIHNSIGQAMVVNGNDHTIELNELFNIGYEEGDGAAMYSGADLAGYGNVYKFNFFHHLMRTPNKKLGRSGLFMDDFQAGATCIGNIFYKSCTNGICMNNGAGHTLVGNIFLASDNGIYQRGNWGEKALRITNEIEKNPKHDYAGLKEDYIGRAEKVVGEKGWLKDPWGSKYPLFKKVMSDEGQFGRLWPIHCTFEKNIFFENRRDLYLYRCPEEAKKKMNLDEGIKADKSFFKDYDNMNFALAKPLEGFDEIPFDKIGLYLDEYRTQMPNKQNYRMALKNCFDGIKSYKDCNKLINTAEIIEDGPMVFAE